MDELQRFDEKQKLTNLMIEKRFVDLERTLDEIRTELEKDSLLEDVPKEIPNFENKMSQLKNEIEKIKEERKKDIEQVSTLVDTSNVNKELSDFKSRFEQELKVIRLLEEKIADVKHEDRTHEFFIKLKEIESRLEHINLRLKSIEKIKFSEPIFIE